MSRAYRVNWVTVATTVTSSDTLTMKLSLLGILPAGEMAALLRAELGRAGWAPTADGGLALALSEGPGEGPGEGIRAVLGADNDTVTVTTAAAQAVEVRGESAQAADANLRAAGEKARANLKAVAAQRLTALEPDLRARLGEAVQRVYVEALRQKAAALGSIESVRETTGADGEYEVTIKVKT